MLNSAMFDLGLDCAPLPYTSTIFQFTALYIEVNLAIVILQVAQGEHVSCAMQLNGQRHQNDWQQPVVKNRD